MFRYAHTQTTTDACAQTSASSFCAFSSAALLADIALMAVSALFVIVAGRISLLMLPVLMLLVRLFHIMNKPKEQTLLYRISR